jgi:hypothetical protein
MSITAVGPAVYSYNPYAVGATTFPVNPTAVGDLLVVVTDIGDSNGAHATALSGGGVSAWVHLAGPERTTYTTLDLWMGVVTTAGPSTVTATIAGSSVVNMYGAQQFTGGSAWSSTSAASRTNASSLSMSYPTLVPSGTNEMYVGCGASLVGVTPGSQTAGYVVASVPLHFMFNPSVSGSQSPTAVLTSKAVSWTVGALISG